MRESGPFRDRHLHLIFAPPGVDRKSAYSGSYLGFEAAALEPAFPALCMHRARKFCFHFETEIRLGQAIDFVDASAMRKILELCTGDAVRGRLGSATLRAH